jgi:hypothetical protein
MQPPRPADDRPGGTSCPHSDPGLEGALCHCCGTLIASSPLVWGLHTLYMVEGGPPDTQRAHQECVSGRQETITARIACAATA